MGNELLVIPEENLDEVIYIIRRGIRFCQPVPGDLLGREISPKVIEMLEMWCKKESEYLNGIWE